MKINGEEDIEGVSQYAKLRKKGMNIIKVERHDTDWLMISL